MTFTAGQDVWVLYGSRLQHGSVVECCVGEAAVHVRLDGQRTKQCVRHGEAFTDHGEGRRAAERAKALEIFQGSSDGIGEYHSA